MTPEQFCYWLQGRAELQPDNPPSAEEWAAIREHLQTVFLKITPGMPSVPAPQYWPPSGVPANPSFRYETTC